jgi:hypothetical protein
VLKLLSFVVDVVPGEAEVRDEVRLDDSMTPQHPQRRLPTVPGKRDPLVRLMLGKPRLGQTLDHSADRRRSNIQRLGDSGGRGRFTALTQVVDDLEIVLDRAGKITCEILRHD